MVVEIRMVGKEEMAVVTSLDIAGTFAKRHADVLRDIRDLECSDRFRLCNFAQSEYLNEQNHKQPMYFVTRDGFTLLAMGYTGEKAMVFKEGYIRQFNAMEKALIGKIREREKGIAVRQALTKAIQQSGEDARMHGHAYSVYTDAIYKSLFGKTAKNLREERGTPKTMPLRDVFTEEELRRVQNAEMLVGSLMGYGWGYDEIKDFVETQANKKIREVE